LLLVCLGIALTTLAAVFVVLALSGGGTDRSAGGKAKRGAEVTRHCRAGEIRLGSRRVSFAAFVRTSVGVYGRPDGALLTTLPRLRESFVRTNRSGVPMVVAALAEVRASDCQARWYRIELPRRSGAASAENGYVRAGAVELAKVRTRVVVDLSQRRLTLFEDGVRVLRAPAAVGAPSTPTPRGNFIVRERIRITDSGGAEGAAAIALSAYSEKLIYWPQGGPIAIHGTNDPSSIGKAVSHGCVRLGAADLRRLFAKVQLGTPVEIVS
jgi:lipoprotein-anchoring transpeptidase ErfK/SrfK